VPTPHKPLISNTITPTFHPKITFTTKETTIANTTIHFVTAAMSKVNTAIHFVTAAMSKVNTTIHFVAAAMSKFNTAIHFFAAAMSKSNTAIHISTPTIIIYFAANHISSATNPFSPLANQNHTTIIQISLTTIQVSTTKNTIIEKKFGNFKKESIPCAKFLNF
jgi:hypothetical protein